MRPRLGALLAKSSESKFSVFLLFSDFEKQYPDSYHALIVRLTHVGTVNGLSWRLVKMTEAGGSNKLQLASCGIDHSVRLFNITIHCK